MARQEYGTSQHILIFITMTRILVWCPWRTNWIYEKFGGNFRGFALKYDYIHEVNAERMKRCHSAITEQREASNDDPINEPTANAIMDSQRVYYTALEYYPYSLYNPQ